MAGLCVNIFGIPILEDADCAAARREARNERKAIEEESDVAKHISDNERKETNTYNRNAQQLGATIARNQPGATGGFIGQVGDFLTHAVPDGDNAVAAAAEYFGAGLPTGTPEWVLPVAAIGGGLAALYLVTRD